MLLLQNESTRVPARCTKTMHHHKEMFDAFTAAHLAMACLLLAPLPSHCLERILLADSQHEPRADECSRQIAAAYACLQTRCRRAVGTADHCVVCRALLFRCSFQELLPFDNSNVKTKYAV
jgi:hypothetical protein